MSKLNFGLIGAGGSGRETMPYVHANLTRQLSVQSTDLNICFVETDMPTQTTVNGYSVISLDIFLQLEGEKYFNISLGDGYLRKAIADQVSTFAAPISISALEICDLGNNVIDMGAVLAPYTLIGTNVKIGKFFHANYFSSISHDCVIGDYVTFAPGARCNGRVHIGDHAYVGSNAVIKQGTLERPLFIGAGAIIGMGAIVTKDVPPGVTVIGNPARELVK
jgi:sugar O-acyltransferase (sialic acid O-acetyltransferase NeuD family)